MSEEKTIPFDPEAEIPFHGYRRFFLDESPPIFDLVPSLIHFYESERFRGTDEDLRLAVLECSTVREARKVAKKHHFAWRKDWRAVRGRVFRSGLAMQVLQSKKAMALARAGFGSSMDLASCKRVGGLPGPFVSEELQAFFQGVSGPGITRLGVIALNGCVPEDIEQRLNSLFQSIKPVSAAIYSGKDADHRIEVWCALSAIPIRLTGRDSIRLREDDAAEVTARVNALLSCFPGARKESKTILAAAAAKRPKIRLLDFGLKSE